MPDGNDVANRAQQWLQRYAAADQFAAAMESWEQFSGNATTATVFGAYDSGKSSLIRRLLVDAGRPVPDWLTISARHETFAASEINYHDILLRDTPGISPGSSDVRGVTNTATALEAIKATDVLIVVVTSQLLTGERALVSTVLDLAWPEDSLWFVISRFDEAGVDPDGDVEGFRRLAETKAGELAEQLSEKTSNAPSARIFVAAPDPYGIAGADPQPDPATWDPYRGWDGMKELAAALTDLGNSGQILRSGAATRYWLAEVRTQLAGMSSQDAEIAAVVRTAGEQKDRIDQWSARLGELRKSARNDLESAFGIVIDQSLTSALLTKDVLRGRLEDAFSRWLERQDAELNSLAQDVESQLERQIERPSWDSLGDLIQDLRIDLHLESPDSGPRVDFGEYKQHLLGLNEDLAKTTKDLKDLFESTAKRRPSRSGVDSAKAAVDGMSKGERLIAAIDVTTKIVPFALDALELINRYNEDAAQADASVRMRQQIEAELHRIQLEARDEACAAFEAQCDRLAAVFNELNDGVNALLSSAEDRRLFCDEARADAEPLLRAGGN